MIEQFERAVARATRDLAIEQEIYLLGFFGSRERMEADARWYVLEHWPMSGPQPEGTYTIREQFRLRLKTDEELAAEGPDQ